MNYPNSLTETQENPKSTWQTSLTFTLSKTKENYQKIGKHQQNTIIYYLW